MSNSLNNAYIPKEVGRYLTYLNLLVLTYIVVGNEGHGGHVVYLQVAEGLGRVSPMLGSLQG